MRQKEAGKRVWQTAAILPWSAWIDVLWQRLSAKTVLSRRIDAQASRMLWERVVREDGVGDIPLFAPEKAAALAQDTWHHLHEWRADDHVPWRYWLNGTSATVDVVSFARWAEHYWQILTDDRLVDEAMMVDELARYAAFLCEATSEPIMLAGFVEYTPKTLRTVKALRAAGMLIHECDVSELLLADMGSAAYFEAATQRDELRQALSWAWAHCEQDHERQIAIIVPDLGERVHEIRRCVDDLIPKPERCNVSLGEPLADWLPVRAALDLLTLFCYALPVGRVAALLQSPYLPGDVSLRMARASLEREWLSRGLYEIGFNDVVQGLRHVDTQLYRQWSEVKKRDIEVLPLSAAPSAWVSHLFAFWSALGWLADRSCDSITYQAIESWQKCVESLVFVEPVAPQLSRETLLRALTQQATMTLFQPQDRGASIHIMGMLEAIGLPFDALWVCGLNAQSWPPPIKPHPLLPLAWQRRQKMRVADIEHAREYTEKIQAQWLRAAPDVIMSFARRENETTDLSPAPILRSLHRHVADYPPLPSKIADTPPQWRIEKVHDERAPQVLRNRDKIIEYVSRGSGVVANQSDCPFRAFAYSRLCVRDFPEIGKGLSAMDHGSLLHESLRNIWKKLQTQKALLEIDERALRNVIADAYTQALTKPDLRHLRRLPKPIMNAERDRMYRLLENWLALEKERKPFSILHLEKEVTLSLAAMILCFRIDRIDEIESDHEQPAMAIIDYKTGHPESTKRWFDDRPTTSQIGLYALACQENLPMEIGAVAYAHIRDDRIKLVGAQQEDVPAFSGLPDLSILGMQTFDEVGERWRMIFSALIEGFLSGDARVSPRAPQVCRYCGLLPFCRVGEIDDEEEEGMNDDV
jgi:probable DNA repair protein